MTFFRDILTFWPDFGQITSGKMSRKNIADAYRDARDIGLDYKRLGKLVRETSAAPKREKALKPLAELMRAIPKGDR